MPGPDDARAYPSALLLVLGCAASIPYGRAMIVAPSRKGIDLARQVKLLTAGTLTLVTLTVGACQGETHQAQIGGERGLCRRGEAEALAGKKRISDDEARQLTGASLVRQIRPRQGVTMDFRQERVTIETDPKTGNILRASCG